MLVNYVKHNLWCLCQTGEQIDYYDQNTTKLFHGFHNQYHLVDDFLDYNYLNMYA